MEYQVAILMKPDLALEYDENLVEEGKYERRITRWIPGDEHIVATDRWIPCFHQFGEIIEGRWRRRKSCCRYPVCFLTIPLKFR